MEHHETQPQKGLAPSQEVPSSLLPNVLGRIKLREQYMITHQSSQERLEALHHPQWEIRSAAVHALGNLGTQAPLEPLLDALQDEHRLVRVAAVHALGRLQERLPMEQLLLALRDEEWEVREMAVLVLGELHTYPVEPLLHIALHDNNSSVREAAQYALNQHDAKIEVGASPRVRPLAERIKVEDYVRPLAEYLLHLWLVFRGQARLLNRSIWLLPALAMAVAYIITFFLHADAGWSLTIAVLSTSATGTAHLSGSENDTGTELALATPTSMRTILVSRLIVVLGYNVALAALTSIIIVLAYGGGFWMLVHLWLGPALFLSSLSLALSLLLGSMFASLIALLLEASQMIQFGLAKPFFIIQSANLNTTLWQLHPVLLTTIALCCIAFAVFYAPRQPRLAH